MRQSEYITKAIWQAAVTLQRQASDASGAGNGYPVCERGEFTLWGDDADGDKHRSDEVRYLSVLNTLITADGDL